MTRATKFFLFKTTGWKEEFWVVDNNNIQLVPKPRELIIQNSRVESIREHVITQNKDNLTIVDKCRDRTDWHTPQGREIMRQKKLGKNHPAVKNGRSQEFRDKVSKTMTGTRRGEFNPMYGRKHNPETIEKIRLAAFKRSKKMWICNPDGMYFVDADKPIPEGYQKGRFYDPYRVDVIKD